MDFKVIFDPDQTQINELTAIEQAIFTKSYRMGLIHTSSKHTDDLIAIIAHVNNQPCGFKIGYRYKNDIFYSWLGGTLIEFRGKGVAKKLMAKQHQVLQDRGYRFVRTTARTHNNAMITLNLKSGFQIVGLKTNLETNELSVQMEKKLY